MSELLNNSLDTQTNKVLSNLKDVVANVMGVRASEIDNQANFFEMGFESVQLLQINGAVRKNFGINISLRFLIENSSTIKDLAIYLAQQIPPIDPLEPIPTVVPSPNESKSEKKNEVLQLNAKASSTSSQNGALLPQRSGQLTDNTAIKQLMARQLQLMSKQLDLLREGVSPKKKVLAASEAPGHQDKQQDKVSADTSMSQVNRQPVNLTIEPKPVVASPTKKGASGNLSPRQQQYLDVLIARVVKRTQKSKQLTQAARPYHANPRARTGFRPEIKEMLYPIHAQRGSDARIWDVDGNEYVDLSMGFGPLLFGHSPAFVMEAIQNHLQQGMQNGPQSHLISKIVTLFCELTGHERVSFCNTGTEAVAGAIRIARSTTGRSKIAIFKGSFHGTSDDVLVMGVPTEDGTMRSIPVASGIPQCKAEEIIVLNYGSPESLDLLKAHAHELAAVLVEPIQSRRPDFQPKEFLHKLRQLTQETGIVLIFDEVITGFRMHPGGIQALWNIQADITTYGKALGAGIPIGAVAGKAAFMDALDGGFWSYGDASSPHGEITVFMGTYYKHPLTMSVVWAVLNHLKNSRAKLQEDLAEKTTKLAKTLNSYFEQKQLPIQVVHFGSLFCFTSPPNLTWMNLLFYHLLEKGIYIWEGRTCFLSTAHTDRDIEQVIQAVKESVVEMQDGGFLPPDPISTNGGLQINHQASESSNGQRNSSSNLGIETFPTTSIASSHEDTSSIRTVPLIEAQKELWFMAQMGDKVSCAYNQSTTIHLRGAFNVEAARKAIQEVVNRHEALRTTFSPEGDYQRIHATLTLNIPLIDFSTLYNSQPEAHLSEFLAREAQQAFDLENGPLLRTQIVKLGEQHHLLVLTVHHIIADGWSLGILQQELAAIYKAECQGIAHQLPQPVQVSEYVELEARQQESPEMAKAEAYWLEQFADSVPVLELPTDRPRPSINTYNGTRQSFTLNKSLYGTLKSLSVKLKTTPFTTLLAGYMALLHRLTGQEDIVVSISSAGQQSVEGECLVGHCVNLLPIRSQVVENPTFTEYLSSVKQLLSAAYDHQIYPFISLVKRLNNLPRDPSRAPLVTAMFNLDSSMSKSKFFAGEIDFERNPTGSAISDIFFDIHQSDGELLVECEYNTDLFDAQTIQRWMGHFQTLLEAIAANPQQRVSQLPLLTVAQQHQLLVEWNDTQADYPQEVCIHQRFEAQVEKTPDAVAVVFEDQQLTYRELNARANRIAHHLRSLGVKSEVLVGICVERSLDMVIGLLGILKAGGAYVPLDPAYPQERLAFMLSDSQAPVLLTQQHLLERLPEHPAQVVCLDTDWHIISQESQQNPDSRVTSSELAYVIYTSGSTGKPKGVQILHRGVVNFFKSMERQPGLTQSDILVAVTSISFDIAALELYLPLITGARLVLVNRAVAMDGQQLSEQLNCASATIMQATPATWQMLLTAGWQSNACLKILCGGEALSRELAKQLLEKGAALWNLYGPTETTIWSTADQVEATQLGKPIVPIGCPIANTQIYLLDCEGQPTPIGVPGELYIGGDGLARGYLNRPDLTAEKFIPNPFSDKPGAQLYKTGDKARYLPNGQIEYIGRIDHQVKVRGFRIELGEIEALINQHPAVRETVVVVRSDEAASQHLVAYVVLHLEQTLTITQLHRFLESKLPNYMVPAVFEMLEALPLTPNGKVARKALPAPDTARPELEVVYQPPQTEVEKAIAKIWQEVLHVEEVGIHDNFFELGGHSLLLVQVHSKLQKIFQRDFPLVEMFQYPTISRLAKYLGQESSEQESFTQHSHRLESRIGSVQRRKQARKEHRAATKQKGVSS